MSKRRLYLPGQDPDMVAVARRIMAQEYGAGRSREHVLHQGVISGLTRRQAESFYRTLQRTGSVLGRRIIAAAAVAAASKPARRGKR